MNPTFLQITVPLILQGMGTLVGVSGFCWAVYTGLRNWNKAEREKREAAQQRRDDQINSIHELVKKHDTKIENIESTQKDLVAQKEKVSNIEMAMDIFKRFHTESVLRQDASLEHFLSYAKESSKLNEKVTAMIAGTEMQEKWMNKYLEAVEGKINGIDKKFDDVIKETRALIQSEQKRLL
jgi:hypothetical protein